MRVSCIIPTKDRKTLVKRAVRSVLEQSGQIPEIVVVDDGSTDGTAAEIKKCFPDVRLVRTESVGPGYARNAGVKASEGDVIMFLDSDDTWLPDHCLRLKKCINGRYHAAYGITRNINTVDGGEFPIPDADMRYSGDLFHCLTRWCFMVPSSVAITRHAFDRAGGFPDFRAAEDWAFFLRVAEKFRFGFTPHTITRRYLHSGSICASENMHTLVSYILKALKKELSFSQRASAEDYDFLHRVTKIVKNEGHTWTTFQAFYTTLKRQNLIPVQTPCLSTAGTT